MGSGAGALSSAAKVVFPPYKKWRDGRDEWTRVHQEIADKQANIKKVNYERELVSGRSGNVRGGAPTRFVVG